MKKNITVNMFGVLYPIDEDAYELLNRYLTNMRGYFSRQAGGGEIADDIEARVAELMNELRSSGVNAVTIEHVQSIIERIGSPEQLDEIDVEVGADDGNGSSGADGTGAVPPPYNPPAKPEKKLYRDVDNKMLGGVLSGVGCYLGVNPLWLRLAALLLAWGSFGAAIVIYIIFWALIPPAVTPEQRLQMKGEPVNFENLRDEFLNGTREMVNRSSAGSFVSGFLQVLCSVFKIILYAVGIVMLVGCALTLIAALIGVIGLFLTPWGEMGDIFGSDFPLVLMARSCSPWIMWINGLSLLVALAITLYVGIHLLMRLAGRVGPMSNSLRAVSVIVWIVSVATFFGSGTRIAHDIARDYRDDSPQREIAAQQRKAEKEARELSYLTDSGWRIVNARNVTNNRYTKTGEHYSGNSSRRYLDAFNSDGTLVYEVVRDVKVAPGTYTLTAVARTDGQGCEIFAINGNGKRYASPIPAYGNKGGEIWSEAKLTLETDTLPSPSPSHDLNKAMAKVNNSRGYGWSRVSVPSITVGPDSILMYGVTNQSPTVSWDGSWLSATSFEVK